MLCRVRLHGPSGRPEKQRDKAGMSQRAGRLYHRYPWGADGTGVSRNSQNGKFYLHRTSLLRSLSAKGMFLGRRNRG